MKTSQNIYRFPFFGNIDPAPASFHDETKWQRYALDFPMTEGTPVLAAYDGLVIEVKDGSVTGGPYRELIDKDNSIILGHENDEFTHYVHLRKGIEVSERQLIKEGDLLGYSGTTGYTAYPHLHFAVCIAKGKYHHTIIPRFRKGQRIITMRSPQR